MMQQTQGVQIRGRDPDIGATLTQDGAKQRLDVSAGSSSLPGFNVPPFDRIDATYPSTTQEVYVYSLLGSTVATMTVDYTDITKRYISTVVRT